MKEFLLIIPLCYCSINNPKDIDGCIIYQTYLETKKCEVTKSKRTCQEDYYQFKLTEKAINYCFEKFDKEMNVK